MIEHLQGREGRHWLPTEPALVEVEWRLCGEPPREEECLEL